MKSVDDDCTASFDKKRRPANAIQDAPHSDDPKCYRAVVARGWVCTDNVRYLRFFDRKKVEWYY